MGVSQIKLIACFAVLVTCLNGCDLPRDPEGTLERVRGGRLRVGLIVDPPFADFNSDGTATGVEVQLVQDIAKELGAEIKWYRGSDARLMPRLEQFELDLIIGGITEDSAWDERVGITSAYWKMSADSAGEPPFGERKTSESYVFAVPPGENRWLLYVDDFIRRHRHNVPLLVKELSAPRVKVHP